MLVFDSVSSRSRNVYTRITTPSNFASASSFSRGGRSLLQGRGEELNTLEAEGQMIQRVMPGLMGLKNNLVLNDEAHHCHRGKPEVDEIADLKGDEKDEAKKNNEAARLWMDLSATAFFIRGSGYAEGTPFPWTLYTAIASASSFPICRGNPSPLSCFRSPSRSRSVTRPGHPVTPCFRKSRGAPN